MLQMLLPKEEKFFTLIEDLGRCANESVQAVYRLVHGEGDPVLLTNTINEIKQEAKVHYATMTREVSHTLITPFDREDLQELSAMLYDIPKLIEKLTHRLNNHQLHDRDGDFLRFANLFAQCTGAMEVVLDELTSGKLSTKETSEKAAQLDHLEDQSDLLLEQTLVDAYRDIADPKDLMLRVRIYEMMETVTDLYRDAANVVLRIVLKHS